MKQIILIFTVILMSYSKNSFGQTQAEMNQKASESFQKADAELNRIYKQLIAMLDKEQKQLLIQAQRDWLKFRDSHCKFETEEYLGGSVSPLLYSTCLEEKTKARIEDLKSGLKSHNE